MSSSVSIDFRDHRLVDLASDIRSRQRSAKEVVAGSLERIDELEGDLNAFVVVDAERAIAQAEEVDARLMNGEGVGPLAGIPIAVKDLEDAAGLPTRYGAVGSSSEPVEGDSVLVARLRAAGCVVVGKTTTPAYGHKGSTESQLTGITRNPWSLDRSPGGSSGGTAAAIASGMVPLATGSDGGGSIRIPAALCGFAGIKTTQGRVPNGGPTPPGAGLFTVKGPMARTTVDTAFALDMCTGPHPTDPFSLPRSGAPWYEAVSTTFGLPTRVAFSPDLGFAKVDSEIAAIVEAAVVQLEAAGVEVVRLDKVWSEDPLLSWFATWAAQRARTEGHLKGTAAWDDVDDSMKHQIDYGLKLCAMDVTRAEDKIYDLNLELDAAFEQAPLLITPMVAGQTPLCEHDGTIDGVEQRAWVSFSYGFNMTRNPAGTVCCGLTGDGMPVGLQVVGRQLEDVSVLQAMAALELVLGNDWTAPIGTLD